MRRLWRLPEDPRRPDRSGLDPTLSGRGRAADQAPLVSRVDPDTGRIRASRNQTVLGALPKDLQTISRELTLPLACVQCLD